MTIENYGMVDDEAREDAATAAAELAFDAQWLQAFRGQFPAGHFSDAGDVMASMASHIDTMRRRYGVWLSASQEVAQRKLDGALAP